MTEIKNFIPAYPDPDDPDLVEKYAHLKEFADLRLKPSEVIPGQPGIPLTNQELQARYFAEHTPNNQEIVWHGLGTGKCILPDTIVETNHGALSIEKLWDSYASRLLFRDNEGSWSNPTTDVRVMSYNEKYGTMEPRPVNQFYRQLVYEDIVHITLDDGSDIRITKAHHLYNGSGWTNKFKEGDTICVPRDTRAFDYDCRAVLYGGRRVTTEERPLHDTNGLLYPKIKHIEIEHYHGWVYDLEIKETHNYVANGIVCHNTCTVSLIVERFSKTLVDGRPRRPALVIVKSPHLRESFRNEIARVCTRDLYLPSLRKDELQQLRKRRVISLTEETKRRRLNDAISKTYTIVTVGELLDRKKMPSDSVIGRDYSDRLIIVDEVHNLRVQPPKKEKKAGPLEEEDTGLIKKTHYDALHKFLHLVKNCRVLLLTATPIWDKVYDIASILNLLLPLDDQLPTLDKFTRDFFDSDGNLRPERADELREKMRGRISYLRPLISSAVRTEIGVKAPWMKYITVYPTAMSAYQQNFADDARGLILADEKTPDAFLSDARDAANCVYPIMKGGKVVGGAYGVKAFRQMAVVQKKRWIQKKGTKMEQRVRDVYKFRSPDLAKMLGPAKGPDPYVNLRRYAAKFATVIEMLRDPNRLTEKAFIYSDSVKGTGGVISLALVMELYGFTWAKSPENIPRKGKPVTVDRPGIFVVITSDDQTINAATQIRKTLEYYNSDDNIYGSRVRIIIGSATIAQGHTLKATRQGHAMMPHWNLPGIDQAMGRIYRAGSFDQLPENERYVNFYRHVAVGAGDDDDEQVRLPPGLSNPSGGVFSIEPSVDTHIYGIAETKEHLNSQIYRVMKEISWDCALGYSRNVLTSDTDGTRECDFRECNYQCDNYPSASRTTGPKFLNRQGRVYSYAVPVAAIDPTNYNLLYSGERVRYYISAIQELFRSYFVLRFDMLLGLLGASIDTEAPLVLRALDTIINHRIMIHSRYGFGSYLKEDKDTYFLDNNVSAYSNYPTSIYSIFPLVSERSNLEDAVEAIQLREDKDLVVEFCDAPTSELFGRMAYRTKIVLLEKVFELRATGDSLGITGSGTSAARAGGSLGITGSADAMKPVWDALGGEIYRMADGNSIHNMYNSEYTGTGYNVFTKDLEPNGKMRVFTDESKTWDYVDQTVESDYIEQIKEQVAKRLKRGLEDNPYKMYGSIDKGLKFKIFDDRFGKVKTGRVCKTIRSPDLWKIFHHLGHLPFADEIALSVKNKSKSDLLGILKNSKKWIDALQIKDVDDMSVIDLQKLYTLFIMKKHELCDSLERWFRGDNPERQVMFTKL